MFTTRIVVVKTSSFHILNQSWGELSLFFKLILSNVALYASVSILTSFKNTSMMLNVLDWLFCLKPVCEFLHRMHCSSAVGTASVVKE